MGQQGQYSLSDIQDVPQQTGQYSSADLAPAPQTVRVIHQDTGMVKDITPAQFREYQKNGWEQAGLSKTAPNDSLPVPAQGFGPGDAVKRFTGSAGQAMGVPDQMGDYIQGPKQAIAHPVDSYKAVAGAGSDAEQDLINKAYTYQHSPGIGNKLKGLAYGVYSVIPGGTALAHAGEQLEKGDIAGGLGTTAGIVAPAVAESEPVRNAAGVVKDAAVDASKKVTTPIRNAVADHLDASAKTDLGKVLAPTKQATKYVSQQKVIPGMQERGVVAPSSQALQDRAQTNMESLGQKINDAYDAMGQQPSIPTKPIIDDLEAYKKNFVNSIPDAQGGTKNIVLDQGAIDRVNDMQDLVRQHGESIDPQSLRQLRQYLDENVAKAKGYQGKTLADGQTLDVQKATANSIRSQLAQAVPGLSDLNSEFSFWKNLNDVLEETKLRRTGQQGGGLGRKISTATGTAVGAGVGHALGGGPIATEAGAVIGGTAANGLSRIVNSTSWNTLSAASKTWLANKIATRNPAIINAAVETIAKQQAKPSFIRGQLPAAPTITPPPPDASGSVPFTPPPVDATTRAQRLGLMLPESTSTPLPASNMPEQPIARTPGKVIARDPKTGQAKVFYTNAPAEEVGETQYQMTKPSFLRKSAPAQEPAPETPSPVERRVDAEQRKRVADMSPEERAQALLTSDKTGLPNRRAFDEAEPPGAVAMSDADGLKALNDQFGYEAGDALLRAKADALKEAGLDAYHDKGDEFLYRGESPEDLAGKLEKAKELLRNRVIRADMHDGTVKYFKGADFSYGTGQDLAESETGLKANKEAREHAGERARGELRGIVEVGPEGSEENLSNTPRQLGPPWKRGATPAPEVSSEQPNPIKKILASHSRKKGK